MKLKIKIILSIIIATCIMLHTNTVNANYQSNNGTKAGEYPEIWITEIREMESEGNVMGLKETINSDGTYEGQSNNIDVHMQKNTELGAVTILYASKEYGKQPAAEDTSAKQTSRYIQNYTAKWGNIKTTTGNVSGVYYDTRGTATAATNGTYNI